MRSRRSNSGPSRRGLTLLEMLVTVALLVLMMTIVTSIFQAATGAMSAAKVLQELDGDLRQLDSALRQDLGGATVDTGTGPIVPPLDPDLNLGYFEVGENQFADLQGEDSDDYLRLTVRAPEGQFFTGRMWIGPLVMPSPPFAANTPNQPVTIQSQYAEVIYFLRNQNLYRRVFLIAPERQQAVNNVFALTPALASSPTFPVTAFSGLSGASWLGMNDLSARPSTVAGNPPILNTLGDLTNRENRMFYPRFSNDYLTNLGSATAATAPADGAWDDVNVVSGLSTLSPAGPIVGAVPGDSVPDWWPTLYPNVFNMGLLNQTQDPNSGTYIFYFPRYPNTKSNADYPDLMSFPYIYPGAYSQADPTSSSDGMLHGMGAAGTTGIPIINGAVGSSPYPPPYGYVYTNGAIVYPSVGSPTAYAQPNHNPVPTGDSLTTPDPVNGPFQTWWGFPTWRETISPSWVDPVYTLSGSSGTQALGLSWANQTSGWLPALTNINVDLQPYNDNTPPLTNPSSFTTPNTVFRDDLIMQGVRSFDVKVYDNAVPGYVDLGYSNLAGGAPNAQVAATVLSTMGHEGHMPPLVADYRPDPNYPNWLGNIGDSTSGINRLRRVWDTWSTDYSNAPATAMVRIAVSPSNPTPQPVIAGPPFSSPIYPSYPPPYPAPLRGIQIQVRVVDPRNEHVKMLTIRHSFAN